MKISAFTLITNPHKFGYAWLESIKSWLPFVDELVIIDGGSEMWVLDKIKNLKSNQRGYNFFGNLSKAQYYD